MSDDQALLIRYAHSRDAEAFAQLVKRYSTLVYSVAQRVTGNIANAEDVTQECFFALSRQAASINGSLPAWLHRVALNLALKVTRNEATRQRHEAKASLPSNDNKFSDPSWSQVSPLIDAALAKLPNELREPLVQHFLLGRTQSEVAKNLQIAQATVSRRLHEGVERLHEHLKQAGVICGATMISTILSKKASAAMSARLSTELAKMALVGPTKIAATASTAAISSHSGLNITLIKGALKLMALSKLKTALVAGVVTILAIGATSIIVKKTGVSLGIIEPALDDSMFEREKVLSAPSNLLIIRRTHFLQFGGYGVWGGPTSGSSRMSGTCMPFETVLEMAYNMPPTKMILPKQLPKGQYDLLVTLPDTVENQRNKLQEEIKKQFGLVGRREMRPTDALLLKVRTPSAPGLRLSGRGGDSMNAGTYNGKFVANNVSTEFLATYLGNSLKQPVIDKTGLKGKYDLAFDAHLLNSYQDLRTTLLNEFGLELAPGNTKIDMLVVDKVP
jgi:uncharacterized protein (TIGR03435 family)